MAATAFDALAVIYRAILPALPELFTWELPVLGNRSALPYSLLVQSPGADELKIQKNPSATGGTGIRHEVVYARFMLWSTVPADVDAASSILAAALTPLSVLVDNATTYTEVLDTMVAEARHRPPRAQGRPIPRGNEVDVDRVYAANVDVRVKVDYY